jgi:hypothetical protein
MRTRKLLLGALAVGLVMPTGGVFAPRPKPDRLTLQNYTRIEKGMSRADVEALMGPPGDHRTRPVPFDAGLVPRMEYLDYREASGDPALRWAGDEIYATVYFDSAGRVLERVVAPVPPIRREDRSPWGDRLWRLKRHWRRVFP